jgi:hypothetical protein
MQLIVITHTFICMYFNFLLCDQSGDFIQTEMCLHTVY